MRDANGEATESSVPNFRTSLTNTSLAVTNQSNVENLRGECYGALLIWYIWCHCGMEGQDTATCINFFNGPA